MTEPDPSVINEVKPFVTHHDADPETVHADDLRTVTATEQNEIVAALNELTVHENATAPEWPLGVGKSTSRHARLYHSQVDEEDLTQDEIVQRLQEAINEQEEALEDVNRNFPTFLG
ncbi:hypothetical protein RYH80_19940 [Halobaculum sp. MBLA0147]|uniref:hypothetical protein n=1 Tax=Halobaculum sp. MBLA0147 TaxID=3079934 RepID=UPI003525C4B3